MIASNGIAFGINSSSHDDRVTETFPSEANSGSQSHNTEDIHPRENLKSTLKNRRNSLTNAESAFLESLLINGNDSDVKKACDTLMDDDMFFEIKTCTTVKEFDGDELFSDNRGTSHHRTAALVERKSCALAQGIWRAHENGLDLSRSASRRSLMVKQNSVKLPGSRGSRESVAFLTDQVKNRRESLKNAANMSFRRRPSRRVTLTQANETLNRRESIKDSLNMSFRCRSTRRLSLDEANQLSKSNQAFIQNSCALYPQRRKSVRFCSVEAGSTVSPSLESLPWMNDQVTPGSDADFSFSKRLSGSTDTIWSKETMNEVPNAVMDQSDESHVLVDGNEEKKEDDEEPYSTCRLSCTEENYDGSIVSRNSSSEQQPLLIDEVPENKTNRHYLSRTVFTREASQRFQIGEGVEVAYWEPENETYFGGSHNHPHSSGASHCFDAIDKMVMHTSSSFDETRSFTRLNNTFQRARQRSYSDDYFVSINSSAWFGDWPADNCPRYSDDDSTHSSDADSITEYYEPWSDDVESTSGRFPFMILGTSACDVNAHPHVFSPPLMKSLSEYLPFEKRGENFWMKYSMVRDGASLETLLCHARGSKYTFLAIETVEGEVFGSFTSEPWRITWNSFGTGNAFLWRMERSRAKKCHSVIEKAEQESRIKVYKYAGTNECIQMCTTSKIAVGGGSNQKSFLEYEIQKELGVQEHEWGFGLHLSNDLLHGTSSPCLTFASPSLSTTHSDGSVFQVMNAELWTLSPCISMEEAEKLEYASLFFEGHKNLH